MGRRAAHEESSSAARETADHCPRDVLLTWGKREGAGEREREGRRGKREKKWEEDEERMLHYKLRLDLPSRGKCSMPHEPFQTECSSVE